MFIDSATNLTVTKVFSTVRLFDSPIGVTTNRYYRDRWALALKIKGKTIYTADGRDVLSDALHPVILPKGSCYSWKCIESGECLIIEFDAAESGFEITNFKIKDKYPIVNGFSKIEKALSTKEAYYAVECKLYLYEMLISLLKAEKAEYLPSEKANALNPATEYIMGNYFDSEITNESLSRLCNMSTVYFRKRFSSVYGISPIKYLHNYRTEKAMAILQSDFESIEQVAQSVGYNSIYHFSKMFKLYTGKSPSEYAKQNKAIG